MKKTKRHSLKKATLPKRKRIVRRKHNTERTAERKIIHQKPIRRGRRKRGINKSTLSILLTFFVIGVISVYAILHPQKKEVAVVPEKKTEVVDDTKKETPVVPNKEQVSEKTDSDIHPVPTPPEPKKEVSAEPIPEKKKEYIAYLTFDADMTRKMKANLDSGVVNRWYSPGIISYLKEEGIPASIFVTGMFAEVYPKYVKEISDESLFSIENHTYSHRAFTPGCYGLAYVGDYADKVYELEHTQDIIARITGTIPRYARLPGLCANKEANKAIKAVGLIASNSGIVSDDAFQISKDVIVQNVLNGMHEGKNVIVLHLGGPNAQHTEEALKIIVPELKKRGFIFKKL
jgi:peptidoglycan/xylan/chitin deacetylase (PgdA/CDA1 family)